MVNNHKNLPKDTFFYLLAIVALVIVAVGFGMAVFNYINFYFADSATDYYRTTSSYESPIRQAMAMLIVVFPVFFYVSRFLRKDAEKNPEKRELIVRKWLLHLTLFAAAIIIIGDLIAVINNFLRGELTVRFILKALTIFFISGSAFYYYLAQIKERQVKWIGAFSWIITAIVIIAVLFGFTVIGSPFAQREKRFDERRVGDLQVIQSQIVNFWQRKGALPANLGELEDSISGFSAPNDPETGQEYEYIIVSGGQISFRLCAVFNSPNTLSDSSQTPIGPPKPMFRTDTFFENWEHDAGRDCFERTIDPDLYPKLN